MSWYTQSGPDKETVVSTRVRLARNLSKYKFPNKMTATEFNLLTDEVYDVFVTSNKTFKDDFTLYRLAEMSAPERLTLAEEHLISRQLANSKTPGAAIIKNDGTVSVMLGEEDHLRIQVILPGLQTEEALKLAKMYDTLLGARLDFARSDRLGYLTACPTNVGTGLRVSAMLHLPALTIGRGINDLLNAVGKLGMTIRGMHGEGSRAGGGFYQLSNQITLGLSDSEIEKKFSNVITQIEEIEKKARQRLLSRNEVSVKNRCMRALGTLRHSYAITSEETVSLLSDARLGAELGVLSVPYDKIDRLLVSTGPGCMITQFNLSEPTERDKKRAELLAQL